MFYKQIPKKEIPDDIKSLFKQVKSCKGQLVIYNHEVVEFVDIIRDDKFDGEWCYRVLHFPSQTPPSVSDSSILLGKIIPLKSVLKREDYKRMLTEWQMNESKFPYNRNYRKEY